MKLSIKPIIVAAAALCTLAASAQLTRSGYFLDDYTYRYQLNPAYGNTKGFVSMPALGNFSLGASGTIGLSDVLYNVNGRTVTFLNPNVSAAEVMSNIGDMNRLGFDLKLDILTVGFKAFGGYNTIGLSSRASVGLKLPGEAFSLLKEGVSNRTYHIANLKGFGTGYAELAFNHSHVITPEFRVGGSMKLLFGAGNANIDFRQADLELGTDDWSIKSDGDINVNMKGFKYKTDYNENAKRTYVNGAEVDGAGLGGFGVAFDLGVVYTPAALPDFEFSASVLDLGFISWSNNVLATTNGVKSFNTDKYTFNVDDDASNSFENEWDKVKDDLSALYELENKGDTGSKASALGATVNIGALYTFPLYRNLKFGLLNTTRVQGNFSWTDFRLSANVMPCKVFDAGINMHAGTYGLGFGWIANLHLTGFNLFLGMDHTLGKLAKQGVPLSSNAHMNLGINFLF